MNPLCVTGTSMAPNLLLMVRILAVAMLVRGTWLNLPQPFLPFVSGLDRLVAPEVFQLVLRVGFVTAALGVLFSRWPRASCLALGGFLLLGVLSSRVFYGNNRVFVSLILLLAGLSDSERPERLFRWQLAVVYGGAGLSKLLEPDWQSGRFLDYWIGTTLHNRLYLACASLLPPLVLGRLLCWATIISQWLVSPAFLVPRWTRYALGFNIIFHLLLIGLTGSTLGEFSYGMLAVTLAFVEWPRETRPGYLYSPAFWLGTTALVALVARVEGWPLRLLVGAVSLAVLRAWLAGRRT